MTRWTAILLATAFLGLTVMPSFSQCSVSVQITNAKCANSCDGIITAIPTGAPPFTYSWSPFMGQTTQTATGLCPNSWQDYTVTVTDSVGCVATTTATITAPPYLNSTQASAFSCTAGTGTASATTSGGVPPYTYYWNPSGQTTQIATGLSIGAYTVTILDSNSCSTISTATVAPISATFTVNYTSACTGKPFFFTDKSAGNPIQWFWNFGDGNTSTVKNPWHLYNSPGTFSITLVVTNGFGCQDSKGLVLNNNPIPSANCSWTTSCIGNPTCFTDLSTIAWGTITSWDWNFGDTASHANNISNQPNPCHVYSSVGNFDVRLEVKSDSGCRCTFPILGFPVDSCLGVQNIFKNKSMNIFPNPFSFSTTLQTDDFFHNATLTVDNCFGQTVKQIKNINGQTITFNRDNLPSGLYFVRLTQDSKVIAVDKFVITEK